MKSESRIELMPKLRPPGSFGQAVVEGEEKGASGAEVVSGEQAETGPAKRVQRARRRQTAASSLTTSPTTIPPRSSTLCPSFMPGQPAIALIVGGNTRHWKHATLTEPAMNQHSSLSLSPSGPSGATNHSNRSNEGARTRTRPGTASHLRCSCDGPGLLVLGRV